MMRIAVAGLASAVLLLLPAVSSARETIILPSSTPYYVNPADRDPRASLGEGAKVTLVQCTADGWCEIHHPETSNVFVRALAIGRPVPEELPQTETAGSGQIVTVKDDVDLYDVPGGAGTVIGMLEKDSSHPLLQCKSDNWCQVDSGWVWGDFLDR